ncbi:5,10-methylenetetrahydrofolate reductase [Desulfuromonas soudanensis]|uniref:Methylenetetrahydrofolate reductase n=1 Tax=Desulfuromonas soudanensis TaxID=1603606 RepID=A0A0M4D7Q0_9BACT|nr:methylenetetrahydrofolate reductase [Desulfuromonas soudanensis]ALC17210.1 5,10-methylenetetrahydrofolate reductase [Desulfuromonas soudanensis]
MSLLQQQLSAGRFVVTAEIAPPKGIDTAAALETARALRDVTAVNVTDNQGANMRMAPLAMAVLLLREGIEPILQLTCRDRNRLALQSDLLGAAALGIENLLLLSGDHPRFGDHPGARPVFDLDSVQLLQGVEELMAGRDLSGRPLCGLPRFFPGAAATPEAEPFELMFQKYSKKVAAGARFFQTQAVFDIPRFEIFMDEARPLKAPVLLGVLLLKSARMARFLNANIPGVRVPEPLIARLEAASDPLDEGVAIARELVACARLRCQGVHLMTLGCEERIPEILG